ncbi:MAG: CPBP family intramembrane metalloprotease [Anaerolineales bacterium]|nr:CPBP family intramembrane metalloprotease [Anaerolineales bacterium]
MFDKSQSQNARRYALIALAVFTVSEALSTTIFRYTEGRTYIEFVILISIEALLVRWLIPLLITYKIEKRNIKSLGLLIPKEKRAAYVGGAVSILILPVFIVGYDPYYPIEFLEQILYIGLTEELFFRGYLMTRMCQWLGKYRGLLAASLLFGFGHIISRVVDQGIGYLLPATYVGLQTFLGGLFFGYLYLRTKNIWPSALLHISTNMYLMDLVGFFTS